MPMEPTVALRQSPLRCYIAATRPAFLTATAVAVILGWAVAWRNTGHWQWVDALLTLLFALAAHAGANVFNDVFDADGSDAHNTARLYPFTGGSRFIQNGVLSQVEMHRFAWSLFLAVALAGFWLVWRTGWVLLPIGVTGLLVGWAYSANPLRLNSRGWGELSIVLGFGLIVVGSEVVQSLQLSEAGLGLAVLYGLMLMNLLYVNQFPDYEADVRAGKRHWVVRLGPQYARWGYGFAPLLASLGLLVGCYLSWFPSLALLGLLAMPLALLAWRNLMQYATQPSQLVPAIVLTIVACHVFGLLVAAGMLLA